MPPQGGAYDPRAAPDDGGKVAAGVPAYNPQQPQPQQQFQQQPPQAYVDPNTGQTVYYAPNGQPYYANQVYPPPPPPNPYMPAYPQQQGYPQQQYQQQHQPGGSGGVGAGVCAGLLGGLLACCCLDAIF
jgi:hypothetical protein